MGIWQSTISDIKMGSVYVLLEKIGSPLNPETALRDYSGQSFYPTDQESAQIRTEILAHGGIGIYPRNRPCSLFFQQNMEEATTTASYMTAVPTFGEFLKTCAVLRELVNEEIFVFAFMMAIQNRQDTKHFPLPPVEEILPYLYITNEVLNNARRQVLASTDPQAEIIVDYAFSGTALDPEYRMAYFREDIGVNSHHWHWHLVYPFTWTPSAGQVKDRKGELFYYMHQQILARYDAERLSNNLNRVRPLNELDKPIKEGYAARLLSVLSGTYYPVRPANRTLADVSDAITIPTLGTWLNRLLQAVHTRSVVYPDESKAPMVDPEGTDILGALVEDSATSVNPDYYGSYHNFGHLAIASAHDPDGRFGGDLNVMGFTATAMRDPVFYRWHKVIDNLFNEHKTMQPPYTGPELIFQDLQITGISINGHGSQTDDVLRTFWKERTVTISNGLNFSADNPVRVRTKHLAHEEFVHNIQVTNNANISKEVMVRIFIAPKFNKQTALQFSEQRRLFIQLDTYLATVEPGSQTLIRRSADTNVTAPEPKSFQQLAELPISEDPNDRQSYCGCGWPHHMLIPKGRPEGMTFTYFVMLTDGAQDKVISPEMPKCADASTYCGLMNQLYPDKRSMGFPFDRVPQSSVLTTEDFASIGPNMKVADIIIKHTGEIVGEDGVVRPAQIF